MPQSIARYITNEPARLILRLCKHWGHRFEVSFDDSQGEVWFDPVRCRMRVVDDGLDVVLEGPDTEGVRRMAPIFDNHIRRMNREPLSEPAWEHKDD
ncbi:DUF2218 domain-containing protein [Paracandidimonas soli]|jgi:hypothetical protein|uniref:DUF2218 domain-containing protein n=2 Tax=Paracandidimonas soli TaxID=1917182 RepID=A0A4R3V487_9BURK|nr:DUF2218 domain-containing protein [Paracandidimonas soli]TCU98530.1 hypothetical protein EV686_105231 [Paracandidimonas soli]